MQGAMIDIHEPCFREVQRFNQKWLWVVVIGVDALVVGLFGYGVVRQLVFGEPWGDRPLPDAVLAGVALLVLLGSLIPMGLLLFLRLVTEVRDDGLYVRFYPFPGRHIRFDQLASCEARTYRPLREYGGWGIRWSLTQGRAYNVSGNRGVQLEFTGGKRLLIGSQRADELAEAIRARMPFQ